jgi:diacylglycerol kinase (ATP)
LVWSAEAFNSAIEKLCDKVEAEQDPVIGKVKDMAAAGVLFMALAAAIVGCMVFLPKIF